MPLFVALDHWRNHSYLISFFTVAGSHVLEANQFVENRLMYCPMFQCIREQMKGEDSDWIYDFVLFLNCFHSVAWGE